MKHRLLVVLLVCCLLCFTAVAGAITDEEVQQSIARDYPEWQIWRINRYGAGLWEGESAHHCEVGLFRVNEKQLEVKELYTLLNTLKQGEPISWMATDWVKVPLDDAAANRILTLPTEKISTYGEGFVFGEAMLPGSAAFLLEEGTRWEWLAAYPDYLVGISVTPQGQQGLRIAHWNGTEYSKITTSSLQKAQFNLNDYHSYNYELEISNSDIEFTIFADAQDTWRLGTINNGLEIFTVGQGGVTDTTEGRNPRNNVTRHYGRPMFPLLIEEMQFSDIPATISEALNLLDAEGFACTKADETALYDAPDGKHIGTCYARVVGEIKETNNDWVRLQIGDDLLGLSAWFKQGDLAYGKDIDAVRCSFPSYEAIEDEPRGLPTMLPGLSIALNEFGNDIWLIGQTINGRWLVQVNEQQVLYAEQDAFVNIGPTEYWD